MSGGELREINAGQRTVAIIGLGYVGLPLALLFVERGFHVTGVDLDPRKIHELTAGRSYITEIQDRNIQAALDSTRFAPSNRYGDIQSAEAVIICVPTPLTHEGEPDLSYLTLAAENISRHIRRGQLIVLESSTYPGTTRDVVLPILEETGLTVGTDYYLSYSPERIDPGNKQFPLEKIPKVVSGITPNCLNRVHELYSHVFPRIHPVSSPETAELAKIMENAYRFVNISFVNELAMLCDTMNLNVHEVIEAAKTKPFGFAGFTPGPGIGGHCIPVDPIYLQWKLQEYGSNSEFIQLSRSINHKMPRYVVEQIERHIAPTPMEGTRILVYGVAYKKDIADCRESASIELLQILLEKNVEVSYHDPYIPSIFINDHKLSSIELTAQALAQTDCVIIATDHSCIPLSMLLEHASFVYDTRSITQGLQGKAKLVRLGGGASL